MPTVIGGEGDVSSTGSFVLAYNFGGADTTAGGVLFKGMNSSAEPGITVDAAMTSSASFTATVPPYSSLSAPMKALVGTARYVLTGDAGQPRTIALSGLTFGATYAVQMWVNDPRSVGAGRFLTIIAGNAVDLDYNGAEAAGGLGQCVTGRFVADAGSQEIVAVGSHVQFNAIQLRLIAPPPAGVTPGAWVYFSPSGNLLYRLDESGQRIADFSHCGYRGGTEPLPNVAALIPPHRRVTVSPGAGDDTARIQAAIDAAAAFTPDADGWRGAVFLGAGEYQVASTLRIEDSGVVLKGSGNSETTGSRLRATGTSQYTVIQVSGSGSRATVPGTTRNLTQALLPGGARTFQVDATTGLTVGQSVIVKRPSTASWLAEIDMDQLGPSPAVPWTPGSKDLLFDRVIARIEGNWITVDAPLPQSFESKYGGGQIYAYTWPGRLRQVGIEDIYSVSDFVSNTDEDHGWKFIQMNGTVDGWVRNITAKHYGYSAVSIGDGSKWLTVADSQCLDPISIATGGRRYSFNNEGAEISLFVNCFARDGRHDFVFGSLVPGPNAFVHCTADSARSDSGPHHRWTVGGLFDNVAVDGHELNVQNRGNSGTGHGWAGAYCVVWNSNANAFRVRNPPTARNWLVGSRGNISSSQWAVGADPEGTYDASGPAARPVQLHSLYYAQLQQRLKFPGSVFREIWLGDIDRHTGPAAAVACDPAWLTQVQTLCAAHSNFDDLTPARQSAFSFDLNLAPGESVAAASLSLSLRATAAGAGTLRLDTIANAFSFVALGWSVSTAVPTVRTLEIDPALLTDGRLDVALGPHSAVDFATLHLQVRKAQPPVSSIILNPVADAYVRAGSGAGTTYGSDPGLLTKDVAVSDVLRESFLRWDLTGVAGKIVGAKVRLAGVSSSQTGNESQASFVADDSWLENALIYNSRPAAGPLFAQWLPVTGQPVEFSVTPQVLDALSGDRSLSLRLSSTGNYGGAGTVTYASRENATAANRPQLILSIAVDTIADWRLFHFQSSANNDPSDLDGDGRTNLEEYILGGNPKLPDGFMPLAISNGHLVFRADPAVGPGYSGLIRRYTMQTVADLTSQWQPVPGYENLQAAGQTVTLPLHAGTPRKFYRLKSWLESFYSAPLF